MRYGEQVVRDIEDFWTNFRGLTPAGRQLEIAKFKTLQSRLGSASAGPDQFQSDSYIMGKMTALADVCHKLARLRQLSGFDESSEAVRGLGDVSNIRAWMAQLGLAEDRREA